MILAESMNKEKPFGYENINLKGWNGPPYLYDVTIKGKIKKMSGFSEQHIQDQLFPKKADKILKIK